MQGILAAFVSSDDTGRAFYAGSVIGKNSSVVLKFTEEGITVR